MAAKNSPMGFDAYERARIVPGCRVGAAQNRPPDLGRSLCRPCRVVPLEGIEQGCKTVVVFSPQPLAGYWEVNQWTPRAAKIEVPATDRNTLAFRLGGNIIAYATGLEMPKPRLTKVELPDDNEERRSLEAS